MQRPRAARPTGRETCWRRFTSTSRRSHTWRCWSGCSSSTTPSRSPCSRGATRRAQGLGVTRGRVRALLSGRSRRALGPGLHGRRAARPGPRRRNRRVDPRRRSPPFTSPRPPLPPSLDWRVLVSLPSRRASLSRSSPRRCPRRKPRACRRSPRCAAPIGSTDARDFRTAALGASRPLALSWWLATSDPSTVFRSSATRRPSRSCSGVVARPRHPAVCRTQPGTTRAPTPARRGLAGCHNLSAAVPRLSISVAALAVSLSMMVAVAVMIGSFRETVSLLGRADAAGRSSSCGPGIAAAAGHRRNAVARSDPSCHDESGCCRSRSVSPHGVPLRRHPHPHRGRGVRRASDPRFASLQSAQGHGPPCDSAIGQNAVVASESFTLKHHAQVGDEVRCSTRAGTVLFRIAAVQLRLLERPRRLT